MIFHSKPLPHRSRAPRPAHEEAHSARGVRPLTPETERKFDIELIDLDEVRNPIKVIYKRWPQLAQVASFLKRYYRDLDEEHIPEDARIALYWTDRRLEKDEIPAGVSTLRYRVVAADEDEDEDEDGSILLTWSSSVELQASEVCQIHDAVEAGETVGGLRRSIASMVDIEDPNRVVILAQGGMRSGLLHGKHWEARKIKTWLCQKLWIDVTPRDSYIVLRGLNQEYLYHPPANSRDHSIDLRNLRHWLRTRIITRIDRFGGSALELDSEDITIRLDGRILTRRDRVLYGETIDFELTREVRDRYVEEEAWLLPLETSCVVCGDDKRVSEMPERITGSCGHEPNTCNDCIGQWIASSLDTTAWDRLRCPECPQLLAYEDVRIFADREVFDRLVSTSGNHTGLFRC